LANNGNTGNSGNNSGTLLVKLVQKTGADSIVYSYSYNGSRKIISLKELGIDDQGNAVNREYHYHRNSSGIITDYSLIDADLVSSGIDSITTVIHYVSSKYTSYVINVNVSGFVLLDSSAFVYDNSGKISGENVYESPSGSGNDYYLTEKIYYTYSTAGNITSVDVHDLDPSGNETFRATTSNISYDSNTNPLMTDYECFAVGHQEWISPNNITSEQGTDSNGPADSQTITTTYGYNSDGKPATSVTTVAPGSTTVYGTYYYQ